MDELVDIVDIHGNSTGTTILKSEAHKLGLLHPTIHVWFYTNNGHLLLQKRIATKKTFPGLWDISVAGHIGAGEQPVISAVREVEEEIGLAIKQEDLHKIGIHIHKSFHSGIIDNELHHIYTCELKASLEDLTLQETEVDDVKLIPYNEYKTIIASHNNKDYVVLDDKYYNLVFSSLDDFLKM